MTVLRHMKPAFGQIEGYTLWTCYFHSPRVGSQEEFVPVADRSTAERCCWVRAPGKNSIPVMLSSMLRGTQNDASGVSGGIGRFGIANAPTESLGPPPSDLCSDRTTLKKWVGTATAVGGCPAAPRSALSPIISPLSQVEKFCECCCGRQSMSQLSSCGWVRYSLPQFSLSTLMTTLLTQLSNGANLMHENGDILNAVRFTRADSTLDTHSRQGIKDHSGLQMCEANTQMHTQAMPQRFGWEPEARPDS